MLKFQTSFVPITVLAIVGLPCFASRWNDVHLRILKFPRTNTPRITAINVLKHVPCGGDMDGLEIRENTSSSPKQTVILIDVDNTLYSERDLHLNNDCDIVTPWKKGIESQIIRNTHLFALKYFNLTSKQCDELHHMYGSTIEGLRNTINNKSDDSVEIILANFYKEVYDSIDFSCLIGSSARDSLGINARSGYDHGSFLQHKRRALPKFLGSICQDHIVYFASNSPSAHIIRVLNTMGLRGVRFAGILSPDSLTMDGPDRLGKHQLSYPTKSSPLQYYKRILEKHPLQSNDIFLLDDSLNNIRAAKSVGIRGILINNHKTKNVLRTLEEGISEALGHILPSEFDALTMKDERDSFKFYDVHYLRAKNKVDFNSIHPGVWARLAEELSFRMQQKESLSLRIADFGAGILSMLEFIVDGGGEAFMSKPSLIHLIVQFIISSQSNSDNLTVMPTHIEYHAYETNPSLLEECQARLRKLGFTADPSNPKACFRRLLSISPVNIEVIVYIHNKDFRYDIDPPNHLDLIVGCCFADLFDPEDLAESLLRFTKAVSSQNNFRPPLVYFPITFSGITQFWPSFPSSNLSNIRKMLPSDTTVFRIYSESLKKSGHNIEPSLLIRAICNHGGSLIEQGPSKWIIDPNSDRYLWEVMMYFIGMSISREMTNDHVNILGWIERSRLNPRPFMVSNVDLLFELRDSGNINDQSEHLINDKITNLASSNVTALEIQFVSPYKVTAVRKTLGSLSSDYLGPNQVEVESLCSLISSGTELKLFKGLFESAPLDVNIKGMSNLLMKYPFSYGYSLVGRIVACGSNIDDKESLIGRLAFSFSPHSSRVIIDRDAIQLVPNGIEAEDAVFMPSMETALSLVHDANVKVGENVAVFGQGLIGLLVTSILSSHCPSCSLTVFDTVAERLEMSSIMGATNALHPTFASAAGPFDISIEVSGNPAALQLAIDYTSNNGRIVVGSWYGTADVNLKLGIDFHRSHKIIQTSQVSNIPPSLAGLWSKERRFELTWKLIRHIRPSRLISKRVTLKYAQNAYELLDGGNEIAICFKY